MLFNLMSSLTYFSFFHLYIVTSFLSLALFQVSISATAQAANSTKHHHEWIGPVGHRVITVDVNGSGEFKSVQAAVDSVPERNRMNVLIQISAGCYM